MILIGKNTSFKAVWDCNKQSYSVYKDNRLIAVKYKFSDVQCYLD